jgi:hypothetical protein
MVISVPWAKHKARAAQRKPFIPKVAVSIATISACAWPWGHLKFRLPQLYVACHVAKLYVDF